MNNCAVVDYSLCHASLFVANIFMHRWYLRIYGFKPATVAELINYHIYAGEQVPWSLFVVGDDHFGPPRFSGA